MQGRKFLLLARPAWSALSLGGLADRGRSRRYSERDGGFQTASHRSIGLWLAKLQIGVSWLLVDAEELP
jgi:hypothetical protein